MVRALRRNEQENAEASFTSQGGHFEGLVATYQLVLET
jgi:hypothetical protein